MATPAPEELFAEWRRTREPALLGAVFDAVAPRLLGLALHLCREPADAEDAVQATFLTAIEKADSWDERRPLEPWLGGILTRRAQQRAASDARRPRLERLNFAEPLDPEIEARHAEAVELLRRKSESFPPETRTLLLLRLEHGLEPAEIAEVLGRPAGTIRVQLQRALERLRRVWPASLALAALGVVLPSRGLALIRAEILRHAGTIGVAAAGEVAASAAGALLVKKALAIVALLLAASGIAWWWIAGSVAEPPLELTRKLAVEERLASKAPENAAAEVEPIVARSAGSAAKPAEVANANDLELALVWASDRTPAPGIGLALEPAADAAAVSKRRLQRRELRSDEQGLVQVRGLSPGLYELEIDREGARRTIEILPAAAHRQTIEIERGLAVRGRVIDREGRAVAGAEVLLSASPDFNYVRPITRSLADGSFTLRDVVPGATLQAMAPGWALSARSHLFGKIGDELQVVLRLEHAGLTIFGTIRDGEGQAVAGATILVGSITRNLRIRDASEATRDSELLQHNFRIGSGVLTARSGEEGRFVLAGWRRSKWLRVWAGAPGFAPRAVSQTLESEAGECSLDIRLERGCVLEGIARDAQRQPLGGATIRVQIEELHRPRYLYTGPEWGRIETRADDAGSFRLEGIPVGPFAARADGLDQVHANAEFVSREGETIWWEPLLGPGSLIEGRVLDEHGAPWVGLNVRANAPPGVPRPASVTTREDGSFELEVLESRPHGLTVQHPTDRMGVFLASRAEVLPGSSALTIVVPRDREPSAWIEGRVLQSETGDAALKIVVERAWKSLTEELHVAQDGAFRAGPLVPGEYYLLPLREHTAGVFGPFEVRAGSTLDVGVLRLRSPAAVELTLRDELDQPVRNGYVSIVHRDSGQGLSAELSNEQGIFVATNLPPGPCIAIWHGADGDSVGPHKLLNLVEGKNPAIEIRLEDLPRVKLRIEHPPSGSDVVVRDTLCRADGELLWRRTGSWDACDVADMEISCRLAPGRYRFETVTDAGRRGRCDFEVPPSQVGPLVVNLIAQ